MPSTWFCLSIHSPAPAKLADFWARALGYQIVFEGPQGEVAIAKDEFSHPGMVFAPLDEPRQGKSRLHIELNPDDQDAEVERLIGLGARRVDVGQPADAGWVVLADPDGNEFCVLAPWRHPSEPK
jgi:predicted enzyme related to lactoylglutathione lyase